MAIFEGAGVAIVTPFSSDGSVNYEMLGKLIDFQIENSTDSIIICGTTGEASTLTHDEHIECIRYAAAHVNKRVPVIAGTGSNCTDTAVFLSKEADKAGADGLLLVSPYYNKATQKGLIEHFSEIASTVSIPIVLYNVPSRTGVNILPSTLAYLAKNVENIVAVKEATGDISQIAQTALECEGILDIYSGNDDHIVPVLSLGGKGVISVLSNIAPKATHDMVMKYLEGDVNGSLELQLKYLPLIRALFNEVNPIPVKAALDMMGMETGSLRKPLTKIEEKNAKILEAELRKLDMITA